MKTLLYIVLALVLAPVVFLAFKSLTSPPPKTGLAGGKLRPCPDSPNCVVSENDTAASRIEALRFEGAPDRAWSLLLQAVERNGGSIREDRDGYLWATFTSRIFRFVDDVEFRLDAAHRVIQVRSASRAGYSDFGINRERVEKLRAAFVDALK
ncbi:MAG TPA: DUF1499 domain-containing protein [Gammaproteobacteria bacterium]|nr:DUF1499 domain-containing protein [Gammaproteobacteria bacterium]